MTPFLRSVFLALAMLPVVALASLPLQATLEEMATQADHVFVGRVVAVDMVDERGKPVEDLEARTGPGLENTIRLHVAVDEVLATNAAKLPPVIPVPLDNFMHFSLGQIRQAHEGDTLMRLVLLKGPDFQPIKAGVFFRPIGERDEALRLHRAAHPRAAK